MWSFDRIFIGGSGGNRKSILEKTDALLFPGGRVVVNAITLDTVTESHRFFSSLDYDIAVIQASITRFE